MRYCSACGALNDTDAKFCGKCGKKLGVESVTEVVPEVKEGCETVETPVVEAVVEPEVETTVTEVTEESIAEETTVEAATENPASGKTVEEPAAEPVTEENVSAEPVAEPATDTSQEPATEPVIKPVAEEPAIEPANENQEDDLTGPGQIFNRPVKGKIFGIISFILSMDALICSFIPFFNIVGIIEAVVALIFCSISKKNMDFKLPRVGSVFAWIAIGLSIVISVLAFFALMLLTYVLIDNGLMKDICEFFELMSGSTLIY